MEQKYFTVTFEVSAESKEQVENWLEQTRFPKAMAESIFEEEIKGERYQERIRFVEDWNDRGEYYLFEGKWSNEEEWGLDTAFKLMDWGEEKNSVLSYQALTKVRELMRMVVEIFFG